MRFHFRSAFCTFAAARRNPTAFRIPHEFELGKVGLPVTLASFACMLLVGRRFLPRSGESERDTFKSDEKYLAELLIKPGSSWIGREISRENFERDYDLELLGLARAGGRTDLGEPFPPLEARDSLRVRGALGRVMALAAQETLELHRPEESG